MNDLIQDPDFVRETRVEAQTPTEFANTFGSGTTVTSINGISGPSINFDGGTTGLSFSTAAPNVSLTGTLVVANGGTGAATAAGARTALEVPRAHSALVAPAVTDDLAAGYPVNSIWTDTVLKDSYISVDSTNTAAVWKKITP